VLIAQLILDGSQTLLLRHQIVTVLIGLDERRLQLDGFGHHVIVERVLRGENHIVFIFSAAVRMSWPRFMLAQAE